MTDTTVADFRQKLRNLRRPRASLTQQVPICQVKQVVALLDLAVVQAKLILILPMKTVIPLMTERMTK